MSLEKCKLEPQWDTTTHLLEQSKSRTPSTPNAGQRYGATETHTSLVRMRNGTATLEDTLAVSYKIKHALMISFSKYTPWYLHKVVEN